MNLGGAIRTAGYPLAEAASLLGIKPKSIIKLREEGKISLFKVAGRLRVPVYEVRRRQNEDIFIARGKSPSEIAQIMNCSSATVRRACQNSRLARKTRKGWRVAPEKLEEFIIHLAKEA